MRHAKNAMRAGATHGALAAMEPQLELLTVSDVMSPEPVCIEGTLTVEAARQLMLEQRISALPIVDRTGRPIGIISKTDILREIPEYEYRELLPERPSRAPDPLAVDPDDSDDDEGDGFFVVKMPYRPVEEIMTPFVFVLDERTPLSKAARVMANERVHRVPIVNGEGKVTGMLSTLDIVRLISGLDPERVGEPSGVRQRRE